MANYPGPNFEFADDSPVRAGRRHRRGKGYQTATRSNATSNKRESPSSNFLGQHTSSSSPRGISTNGGQAGNSQYAHKSDGPGSHGTHQSFGRQNGTQDSLMGQQHHQHPQSHYYTADWDSNHNGNLRHNDQDHNSCAGSLTYSASSSVQSGMSSGGESSNDSSFADIIKLLDSEGEGASEIKAFIAARSEAASEGSTHSHGSAMLGMNGKDSAVAGWMQRVDARSRQQQHNQYHTQQQLKKHNSSSARQNRRNVSPNVSLNYSKDDSDDGDYNHNKVLETIAGQDDDRPRRNAPTYSSRYQDNSLSQHSNPQSRGDSGTATYNSVSSPHHPNSSGNVTPPPNSRNKRTSTPPSNFGPAALVRTNSHRSKSSSDGSWDTPTKSPPHPSHLKPPHARSAPVVKSSRRSGKSNSNRIGSGGVPPQDIGDISEAVYTKFWMCGFTDAFNFDKFQK